MSNKKIKPRFAGVFIILQIFLNTALCQENDWTWNWQDSSYADVSKINEPELLYQYYRIQIKRSNNDEAMLAAYTLIFRFNEDPLTAKLQQKINSDILNTQNKLTKSQEQNFRHFRQYYLHRLPVDFQKEWLTAYYYKTGYLDSLEWLANRIGSKSAKIELMYHYAEKRKFSAAKDIIWNLPIHHTLKDSVMQYLDSLISVQVPKQSFSFKHFIPAYTLIKYQKKDTALRTINSAAMMFAGLASYIVWSGTNPLLIIPYAVATELFFVLNNHQSAHQRPADSFEKTFPRERLKNI